jgi:hypothetical protein
MTTVASRTFRSTPYREALETWREIVDLLTVERSDARDELLSIKGIAASVIADKGPEELAIVVTCDGPRTRIYCTYDDGALDGSSNESTLGFNPLKGDWHLSLPCAKDDVSWISGALKEKTSRITARDHDSDEVDSSKSNSSQTFVVDAEEFLRK